MQGEFKDADLTFSRAKSRRAGGQTSLHQLVLLGAADTREEGLRHQAGAADASCGDANPLYDSDPGKLSDDREAPLGEHRVYTRQHRTDAVHWVATDLMRADALTKLFPKLMEFGNRWFSAPWLMFRRVKKNNAKFVLSAV